MPHLSATEITGLRAALDDEYQALATYAQVLADFGDIRPFANIVRSEARHAGALLELFERHGIPAPANSWHGRVRRYPSVTAACADAVRAEVANAALYDRLLASTTRPDLLQVYRRLRDASQERHLPAFRRCATRAAAAGGGRGGRCTHRACLS